MQKTSEKSATAHSWHRATEPTAPFASCSQHLGHCRWLVLRSSLEQLDKETLRAIDIPIAENVLLVSEDTRCPQSPATGKDADHSMLACQAAVQVSRACQLPGPGPGPGLPGRSTTPAHPHRPQTSARQGARTLWGRPSRVSVKNHSCETLAPRLQPACIRRNGSPSSGGTLHSCAVCSLSFS
jgi:hypothetical protein